MTRNEWRRRHIEMLERGDHTGGESRPLVYVRVLIATLRAKVERDEP